MTADITGRLAFDDETALDLGAAVALTVGKGVKDGGFSSPRLVGASASLFDAAEGGSEIIGGGVLYTAARSTEDTGVLVHGSGNLSIGGEFVIHNTAADGEVWAPGGGRRPVYHAPPRRASRTLPCARSVERYIF